MTKIINQWRRGGNQNTQRKSLTTSFRKCHILKPKNSSPNGDWNPHWWQARKADVLAITPPVTLTITPRVTLTITPRVTPKLLVGLGQGKEGLIPRAPALEMAATPLGHQGGVLHNAPDSPEYWGPPPRSSPWRRRSRQSWCWFAQSVPSRGSATGCACQLRSPSAAAPPAPADPVLLACVQCLSPAACTGVSPMENRVYWWLLTWKQWKKKEKRKGDEVDQNSLHEALRTDYIKLQR